ncbi:uncharacterized protein LOC141714796 [Apium graveolens]|uniref:uncharacterized protein LOC141714796 n=1 Tax=Apium graveolens TaxID=4045 RepID=UPI003D7ADFF4
METVREDLEVEVPKIKLIRVRKAALEGVADALKEHYNKVWDFGYELLKNNPKNRVEIKTNRLTDESPNTFQRLYICYYVLKEGWKSNCRPVLGLDGCFLKTVCGGKLLIAVGRDGNNQMFHVAYAIVDSENTSSWRWFLDLSRDDLDLGNGNGYTIISDQQKGLENAMREFLPEAEHRLCLLNQSVIAATATYPTTHVKAMKGLEKISKKAHAHLAKFDAKSWTKAYISTTPKTDNVDNNILSHLIHGYLVRVLNMLQEIYFKLMRKVRLNQERMEASQHQICPVIRRKLDFEVRVSRDWQATWDG